VDVGALLLLLLLLLLLAHGQLQRGRQRLLLDRGLAVALLQLRHHLLHAERRERERRRAEQLLQLLQHRRVAIEDAAE
jgi:hypothetical protein